MRTVSARTARNTNPCYYETLLVVERYRGSRGTGDHSFRFEQEGMVVVAKKKGKVFVSRGGGSGSVQANISEMCDEIKMSGRKFSSAVFCRPLNRNFVRFLRCIYIYRYCRGFSF